MGEGRPLHGVGEAHQAQQGQLHLHLVAEGLRASAVGMGPLVVVVAGVQQRARQTVRGLGLAPLVQTVRGRARGPASVRRSARPKFVGGGGAALARLRHVVRAARPRVARARLGAARRAGRRGRPLGQLLALVGPPEGQPLLDGRPLGPHQAGRRAARAVGPAAGGRAVPMLRAGCGRRGGAAGLELGSGRLAASPALDERRAVAGLQLAGVLGGPAGRLAQHEIVSI